MNLRLAGLFATTAFALGACNSTPAVEPARDTVVATNTEAPYTPVVSLNEIMVYVVDAHSNELWDGGTKPPTNEAGWNDLQRAAVAIAASGNLTRLSGNGPTDQRWTQQADWARHSQSLATAGLAALTAVRARDKDGLARAGDELVLTCINCHREYKLDVPKIWTDRQFPPEETAR